MRRRTGRQAVQQPERGSRAPWACAAAAGVAVALAGAMLAGALSSNAAAAGQDGKAVFDQLCQGCHTIGGGKLVGPDLQGVAERRTADWVRAFVLEPDKVIAAGDPIAKQLVGEYNNVQMPNLGVTEAQIGQLLTFLGFTGPSSTTTAATTTTTASTTTPQPAAASGNAERGKELFKGGARLGAGGPACLSCHSVAGVGALGGGKVGPDLTGAYKKYGGAQGLLSALKTLPFPTMAPIFSRNQLTAREQADLVVFLKTAPDLQRSGDAAGKLIGLSLAGVALLGILAMAVWRRRLNGVRRPLVNRSRGK
ncbi:MAG: cytochrome c [Gaiellaceae bacterium]